MTADQEARLKQVVAEALGLDEDDVADQTSPETVAAWTSLHHLTLLSAVEEALGVQFSMEEMAEAQSYSLLQKIAARHL